MEVEDEHVHRQCVLLVLHSVRLPAEEDAEREGAHSEGQEPGHGVEERALQADAHVLAHKEQVVVEQCGVSRTDAADQYPEWPRGPR